MVDGKTSSAPHHQSLSPETALFSLALGGRQSDSPFSVMDAVPEDQPQDRHGDLEGGGWGRGAECGDGGGRESTFFSKI